MRFKTTLTNVRKRIAVGLFALLATHISWGAPSYAILHAFGKLGDGGDILTGVVLDKNGKVFGNTSMGGYGYGTVFKLTRQPDGQWKEKKLYEFRRSDPNGYYPIGGVILDANGNVYGTAGTGGGNHAGTAFELTPGPSGWTFNLLYAFCSLPDCTDGGGPEADLTLDEMGNLYGTGGGGTGQGGVVFQLTPGPSGWTEGALYNFCSQPNCADGSAPGSGLILDAKGNLYGTTRSGGAYYHGTVFKLKRTPDGSWKERVLHSFGSFPADGEDPMVTSLALDSAGSLYGTTNTGGRYSCGVTTCGTVFRLTRQPNGQWKETIIHHFKGGKAGAYGSGGVTLDAAGNLYGMTGGGGTDCDCGVVYKLSPNPDDTWTYTVLHRFTGYDGAGPQAKPTLDAQGNLYGTTEFGGPNAGGVVFMLSP